MLLLAQMHICPAACRGGEGEGGLSCMLAWRPARTLGVWWHERVLSEHRVVTTHHACKGGPHTEPLLLLLLLFRGICCAVLQTTMEHHRALCPLASVHAGCQTPKCRPQPHTGNSRAVSARSFTHGAARRALKPEAPARPPERAARASPGAARETAEMMAEAVTAAATGMASFCMMLSCLSSGAALQRTRGTRPRTGRAGTAADLC